ncbi:OmpA family protein [Devosia faecipullorum]|uniref:OmpA family protein n=1 Tax=Devosia faecipullorum TaxID=2755039 RepID=UPI00187B9479|nr:OmpA family protein [Devosia faecipullorum]MBE7732320.1 OmpA family protein [Devosia faecipullorum]
MKPFLSLLVAAAMISGVQAQDGAIPDALDFFRIANPEPQNPRIVDLDETWLITGPVSEFSNDATKGDGWQFLEGQLVFAYYRFDPGSTGLQIQREYEGWLAESGYEVKFSCATDRGNCFTNTGAEPGNTLGILLDKPTNMPSLDAQNMSMVRNYFNSGGARYTYAEKTLDDVVVHVAVALADTPEKGVMAVTKSVITGGGSGFSGASRLLTELREKKTVTLNNLLFDVGSDILLPESRDQIFEIAMMLREDDSLKLEIVGHTDSDGGAAYNLDLSKRRAASVVRALVEGFDIESGRLTSSGKGLSEPVASNSSAAGKAQNRRVELRLQ